MQFGPQTTDDGPYDLEVRKFLSYLKMFNWTTDDGRRTTDDRLRDIARTSNI